MTTAQLVRPRYSSKSLYTGTRGGDVLGWGEQHLRVLKGPKAGQPLEWLLWQVLTIEGLYELRPDGHHRYRRGLVGVGRQNGKSIQGSGLALEALYRGPPGSEVYSAAGDRMQARIVFGEAKRQVQGNPALERHAKVYRDAIEIPSTGNVYRALSADARLQQGLSPYFVVFDEVHVQRNDDLWDALSMGMGARPDAIILGITTAGDHEESLCGRLYEYGRQVAAGEIEDESFFFEWWEPQDRLDDNGKPQLCDLHDRDAWIEANPGLAEGTLLEEDLVTAARQSTPGAFRRYRLNQWVAHGGTRWMDMDAWDTCEDTTLDLPTGCPVVLAFDGSVNEDATALLAFRTDLEHPALAGAWVWERHEDDGDDWQVDREAVKARVEWCFSEFDVRKFGADPAYWRSELQLWESQWGRKVVEWPVTNARMGPAVTEVYKRVKDRTLVHNGDAVVRRHVRNAIEKPVSGGHVTIVKQKPKSIHKIDAAVAVCIGVDMWTRYGKRRRGMATV